MSSAEVPMGASVTSGGKPWGVCSPPREPCGLQPGSSNCTASSSARPPLLELRGPHVEEWQVSGPLLSACPNTEERGADVSHGVNGDLSEGRRPQPWTVGVALPPARWPRGWMQPPGRLCTGSAQVRTLTRAGPARFSPIWHSWNSSAGPALRPRRAPPRNALVLHYFCFSSHPSKPPQNWWHKTAMSYYPLAWSGSYGLSQFSLRVSPGCRWSRVGSSHLQGFHKHRCGGWCWLSAELSAQALGRDPQVDSPCGLGFLRAWRPGSHPGWMSPEECGWKPFHLFTQALK